MAKPEWITLSESAGTLGLRTISLTVSPNETYSARTSTLTVKTLGQNLTQNIVVNQAQKAATGQMSFDPTGLTYTYQGGILYLHFTANTDWNVVSWPSWVGISGDAASGSSGSFTWGVTAAANNSNARDSQFTFYCGGNYYTLPIHQEAYQSSPALTVSPTSITGISSGGSAYNIMITSNTGWTISSYPAWTSFNVTGGTGNGGVRLTVNGNTGGTRNGQIIFTTVDGSITQTVNLSQNEAVEPSSISVSPNIFSDVASGGTAYTITVSANTSWTITSYPSWVTLSSTGGTGNDTITVTVSANTGHTRSDGIIFKTTDNAATASLYLVQIGEAGLDYSTEYLTFEILSNGTLYWYGGETLMRSGTTKTIEYSKNGGEWSSVTCSSGGSGTTIVSVASGDLVRFRGDNNSYYYIGSNWGDDMEGNCYFRASCRFNIYGSILSLKDSVQFVQKNITPPIVYGMFRDCTKLISAENLYLGDSASTLCFAGMFDGCTSLTTAPELPATTVKYGCYSKMFGRCSSLTTAPELPAQTLAECCYALMFQGCYNLNYIKCLATDISANECTGGLVGNAGWVSAVKSTGLFVKAANMNDWTTGTKGIPSNWTVQDA